MYFFFFFPVGTDTRVEHRPVGTFLLLVIIWGLFAVRFVRPDISNALILSSFTPADPRLSAAVLSLFLHAGWGHIIGNSLYLWIFGRQFEGRIGFLPLAAVFLLGGVSACWVQSWLTPPESWAYYVPLVGASGSVAALLGATVVRFHHRRVRVLWFLFAFLGGMTRGGATYLNTVAACGAWFVYQILYLMVGYGSGGGGVAYAAHAGGFVAGVLLALMLGLHRGPRTEIHLDRGRRYFERNDWYAAAGELTSHLEVVPDDTAARRMRARCHVLLGAAGEASSEYLQLFREARRRGNAVEVASLYREMRTYGVSSNLSERMLLRLAFDFQKAGRSPEAAEIYRELVQRFPEGEVTDLALIRRAEILWSELGRYDDARACYRQLLETQRDTEWRELAEARLRSMDRLSGRGPGRILPSPDSPSSSRRASVRRAS